MHLGVLALLFFVLFVVPSSARSLHLYASRYQVEEGVAVTSIYLDNLNGVPVPGVIQRTNILSWSWDFEANGN